MADQAFAQGSIYGFTYALTTNSTYTGDIVGVDTAPELTRKAIETTHSTSTGGWKTFMPGDIKDGGMFAVTVKYNTQLDYKTLFAAGCDTLTLTFPKRPVSCGLALPTTAATWASAVVFESASPAWEFEEVMVITLGFKCSGPPTYTPAVV